MKKNIKINLKQGNDKGGLVFERTNYILMIVGLLVIILGLFLMSGAEANTKSDGVYDPNYFNYDIFSLRRLRIAPMLILIGFVIEVIAIFYNKKQINK